jgi:hypothetical protein
MDAEDEVDEDLSTRRNYFGCVFCLPSRHLSAGKTGLEQTPSEIEVSFN